MLQSICAEARKAVRKCLWWKINNYSALHIRLAAGARVEVRGADDGRIESACFSVDEADHNGDLQWGGLRANRETETHVLEKKPQQEEIEPNWKISRQVVQRQKVHQDRTRPQLHKNLTNVR